MLLSFILNITNFGTALALQSYEYIRKKTPAQQNKQSLFTALTEKFVSSFYEIH